MAAPVNEFKKSPKEGRQTIGCWLTQGTAIAAEIAATADFDWLTHRYRAFAERPAVDTGPTPGDRRI